MAAYIFDRFPAAVRAMTAHCKLSFAIRPGLSQEDRGHTKEMVRTHCTSAVYIATYAATRCRTSLVFTTVLHSYALLVCCQYRGPPFVCISERRWYATLRDICMCSASATITAGYIYTHCSPTINIAKLHSYALQNPIGMYRCPTFVRAARLLSTSLT